MKLEDIQREVEKILSQKKYYHSIFVMDKCEELAKIYDVDIEVAQKVGITHDIAKEMPAEAKLKYIKLTGLKMDKTEERYPTLLHAKIGADLCMKKFGFTKQMGQAIEAHTTGKEDMDILAKILYIADWIGEDRDYDDTQYLRKLAETNINKAIIYALDKVIEEKIQKKEEIHVDTILTRNSLIRKGGI